MRGPAALRRAVSARLAPTRPLERQLRGWLAACPSPDPAAFARFGEGSWIVPPAEVEGAARIEIGAGVVVLEQASLRVAPGARLVLGDGVRLAPFATIHVTHEVVVGDHVSTSDHVAICDSWAPVRDPVPGAPPIGPGSGAVRIGAGAYLGWGSFVSPGVTVGEHAYVGEGAVVLEDVPARTVVFGNPARIVRSYEPARGGWS